MSESPDINIGESVSCGKLFRDARYTERRLRLPILDDMPRQIGLLPETHLAVHISGLTTIHTLAIPHGSIQILLFGGEKNCST